MPKKNSSWGTNPKVVEARERKVAQKRDEAEQKQKATEDAAWEDNDRNIAKKLQRKEQNEQKRQEALAKKQESKQLLAAEEAKLCGGKQGAVAANPLKKVTRAELDMRKEKERKERAELVATKKNEEAKISENPEMEEENPNRKMAEMLEIEGAVEARSVGDALAVLSVGDMPDRHPEKRMKAAYAEYEERELPKLKADNPNLRLSQLRQLLRKEWQKSPENPMNQT